MLQRTILIKINVLTEQKKECLLAFKCAKVEDNNIQK